MFIVSVFFFFFFKQKTAYEVRISDWSSDVCSSDLLVVGAETLTRMVDWSERETCVLFGDGAGAVVLEASSEPGIYATCLHADGGYKHLLYRSEERRVGKEGVSTCRSRRSPNH